MTATIRGKLRRELDKVNQGSLLQDLPLAATLGMELGIVEAHEQYAHFQHSVIQAYLGSRYLAVALDDPDYLGEAFRDRVLSSSWHWSSASNTPTSPSG